MRTKGVFTVVRAVAYVLAIAFLAYQLWRVRDGIGPSLRAVGWGNALLATVLAVVGGLPGFFGWRLLLSGVDVRLPVTGAIHVYFLAGLTRYLPGGLWPAVAHAAQAKPLGAPPARMAGAYLASQGLGVVAGLAVGLIALPRLVATNPVWWVLVPVLLVALVPVARPALLGGLLGVAQRLLRRPVREPVLPDRRTLVAVTGLMALGWVISGLHVTVLAAALGADVGPALIAGVGGFALAVVTGIAAVVLPSGIGVRELVLGLTVAALVSGPALVTLVALSRILLTAADLVSTAVVLGLLTVTGRAPRPQPEGVS
jgi:hypothetical protein